MLWGFHFIYTERAVQGVYNFERKQFIILRIQYDLKICIGRLLVLYPE